MSENRSNNSQGHKEMLFSRSVVTRLARINPDFLRRLEEEEIIRPRGVLQGEECYGAEDIADIARIRRLHEDLGLDLGAVEVVLQMRRRILELLQRMEEMERRLAQRERELLAEIQELRRYLGISQESK